MKSNSFKPGVETRYLAAKVVYATIYKGQSLRSWANKKKRTKSYTHNREIYKLLFIGFFVLVYSK